VNGQELLEKVRGVYASFDSYTDVGVVESPDLPGPGLEFETHFKRPLNFRFHWLSWHPYFGKTKPASENTVWSNGQTFTSSYHGDIKHPKSLAMLVAGATGISRSSVHNILNILVPGALKLSHNWHEMAQVKSLPDELVHNKECFHIIGNIKNTEDCELWLEKETFIVRRIKETLIITEEMSAKMREEQRSEDRLKMMRTTAKKAGLSDEIIEETIAHLKTESFKPMTYRHIYDYTKVSVNEPIEEGVFNT
jgi:hypothetical protein